MSPILRASAPMGWLSATFGKTSASRRAPRGTGRAHTPLRQVLVTVTSHPSEVAAIVGETGNGQPMALSPAPGPPVPSNKETRGTGPG